MSFPPNTTLGAAKKGWSVGTFQPCIPEHVAALCSAFAQAVRRFGPQEAAGAGQCETAMHKTIQPGVAVPPRLLLSCGRTICRRPI